MKKRTVSGLLIKSICARVSSEKNTVHQILVKQVFQDHSTKDKIHRSHWRSTLSLLLGRSALKMCPPVTVKETEIY